MSSFLRKNQIARYCNHLERISKRTIRLNYFRGFKKWFKTVYHRFNRKQGLLKRDNTNMISDIPATNPEETYEGIPDAPLKCQM